VHGGLFAPESASQWFSIPGPDHRLGGLRTTKRLRHQPLRLFWLAAAAGRAVRDPCEEPERKGSEAPDHE